MNVSRGIAICRRLSRAPLRSSIGLQRWSDTITKSISVPYSFACKRSKIGGSKDFAQDQFHVSRNVNHHHQATLHCMAIQYLAARSLSSRANNELQDVDAGSKIIDQLGDDSKIAQESDCHVDSASIDHAGFDAAATSSSWDWPNLTLAQEVLNSMHELSGLPWWATVAVTTWTMRTALIPLAILQQHFAFRFSKAAVELQAATVEHQEASKVYMDPGADARYKARKEAIYTRHKVRPWQLLPLMAAQGTLFVSFFFTSLALPDPYHVLLPLAAGATILCAMELSLRGRRLSMPGQQYRMMIGVQRIMCMSMVPLLAGIKYPAAVYLYWLSNNLFSILQVALLNNDRVRRWIRLPPLSAAGSSPVSFPPL